MSDSRPARVALIVAMARNRVIGRAGGLPWRIPSDLRHFKRLTIGKPLIMGRRTWESLGRPLADRDHLVISRQAIALPDGCERFPDLRQAITRARELAARRGADEVMVIGGGEVYRLALPEAERIYLTEVDCEIEGDTTFPQLDPQLWREVSRAAIPPDPRDEAPCTAVVLERRR